MMKILIIPDIHGCTNWRDQVKNAIRNNIHIVFLGDYVDSFVHNGQSILENLRTIINLKKKHPELITLLLGNHDYAYVFGKTYTSGFNPTYWNDYRDAFNENWDLFDMAYGFQGKDTYTLITHAGLTNKFYDVMIKEIEDKDTVIHDILTETWKSLSLHELLNWFKDQVTVMWRIGPERRGIHSGGSIIWTDKKELLADAFNNIDQIVGHTVSEYVEIRKVNENKIYFTDVHDDFNVRGLLLELE